MIFSFYEHVEQKSLGMHVSARNVILDPIFLNLLYPYIVYKLFCAHCLGRAKSKYSLLKKGNMKVICLILRLVAMERYAIYKERGLWQIHFSAQVKLLFF
jgi:hypothetical protein